MRWRKNLTRSMTKGKMNSVKIESVALICKMRHRQEMDGAAFF